MRRLCIFFLALILVGNLQPAHAATIPFSNQQAVVLVHCGNRQGSGVVINGERGFVLTNAHVLLDLKTKKPSDCEVGFIDNDNSFLPSIYYDADWDRYVYDESHNQDFAILRITQPQQIKKLNVFPFLKTDEFSEIGDALSIIGYPSTAKGKQSVTSGTINGLEQGIIKTDAVISPGASGGAGINQDDHLTGIATRILLQETSPGVEEVVDYELVDIRAILTWLDTFGDNAHDIYVVHADPDRYHKALTLLQPGHLQCSLLAKSELNSTVFCLKNDGTRSVFPNDTVFLSWFSDFSAVQSLPLDQLSQYRLTQNITIKPGALIKIATDPKVYVVADINGTIRWIESESKARELYGDGWAGFVKDVPDTFFTNYHVGSSIQ